MRRACRAKLAEELRASREFTLALLERLSQPQWQVPYLETINPPLWELGHVGWFQEFWCLRQQPGGRVSASILAQADALYDSRVIAHQARWSLPLPSIESTLQYLQDTLDATLMRLAGTPDDDDALYPFRLVLFHEYMHQEAFAYTWQTLGYECPVRSLSVPGSPAPGEMLALPAGQVRIGSVPGDGFAFDNEQWAVTEPVAAFRISSRPVSNREFAAFVRAGGYRQAHWWQRDAFERLQATGQSMPRYWRGAASGEGGGQGAERDGGYEARAYSGWDRLEPLAPVVHVSADEAQAYCRWAGVRLPTEAEWVRAARELPDFEWGDQVWEWTASAFEPLPGFQPGPYREYSAPFFGTHRVVRGGSAATPRGMVDDTFRNFYEARRSDIFVGFRICEP